MSSQDYGFHTSSSIKGNKKLPFCYKYLSADGTAKETHISHISHK